jgi:hypothetical protein
MKSTGFASMLITVVAAVWADGCKTLHMVIHKEKDMSITHVTGPLPVANQEKGWVNSNLLNKWIDLVSPVIDTSKGKCLVWDSCCAHISKAVKEHYQCRNIELIVIPGGMTPYLQAGDIGIYCQFKDMISVLIDRWKQSDAMEYTRGGNPKPPANETVHTWVSDGWKRVNLTNVQNSIATAGFSVDETK